ncbi:hypothetical protein B0T16DRAFT_126667 [Cercophora newfieldiana]|uniref:Uncharacterized protein n=1 Tax=Cercophora newfieldiana TaxID=92897 RepID=A0AA39YC62_9PEZI|nr:hypothetical protein B0T16DRAFT_126667 [Cercophora newfieldiana]
MDTDTQHERSNIALRVLLSRPQQIFFNVLPCPYLQQGRSDNQVYSCGGECRRRGRTTPRTPELGGERNTLRLRIRAHWAGYPTSVARRCSPGSQNQFRQGASGHHLGLPPSSASQLVVASQLHRKQQECAPRPHPARRYGLTEPLSLTGISREAGDVPGPVYKPQILPDPSRASPIATVRAGLDPLSQACGSSEQQGSQDAQSREITWPTSNRGRHRDVVCNETLIGRTDRQAVGTESAS